MEASTKNKKQTVRERMQFQVNAVIVELIFEIIIFFLCKYNSFIVQFFSKTYNAIYITIQIECIKIS